MVVKDVKEALLYVQSEYDKATRAAADEWPTIQKVESCKFSMSFSESRLYTKSYYGSGSLPTTEEGFDKALTNYLAELQSHKIALEALHANNAATIASNTALATKLRQVMVRIGMPANYYKTTYSPRGKVSKDWVPVGYESDIGREIQTSDGYAEAMRLFPGEEARAREFVAKAKQKLQQEVRAKQLEEEKKKKEHEIVYMRVKYGCDPQASPSDILEVILSKDKYLALGCALEKNRGDWTEGYDYAKCGLSEFKVETEEDVEIEKEISILIQSEEDGDIDGRVFRDCLYNYTYLFGKVDEALLKDYRIVRNMEDSL